MMDFNFNLGSCIVMKDKKIKWYLKRDKLCLDEKKFISIICLSLCILYISLIWSFYSI